MMTCGAIGKILSETSVTLPTCSPQTKLRLQLGSLSWWRSHKYLGQSLLSQSSYVDNKRLALVTFGEAPFTMLLPLSMIKPHVKSEMVCTYQQISILRQITPPSIAGAETQKETIKTANAEILTWRKVD